MSQKNIGIEGADESANIHEGNDRKMTLEAFAKVNRIEIVFNYY